jgi:hypothetical protein
MKALVNPVSRIENNLNTPFIVKKNDMAVRLIGFQKMNQYHILQLGMVSLERDNYRIFLNGHYLTLIVSEHKEISRPVQIHNNQWGLLYHQDYEVMKNVDIWLPGDNFYLIKHYLMPGNEILKIFLGEMHMN